MSTVTSLLDPEYNDQALAVGSSRLKHPIEGPQSSWWVWMLVAIVP